MANFEYKVPYRFHVSWPEYLHLTVEYKDAV